MLRGMMTADWRRHWRTPAFFGAGLPYWMIPCSRVKLPGALLGPVLAALWLLPPAVAAEPPGRVEQEAFVFSTPPGWKLLKNEGLNRFALLSFHNAEGEVLQLSVSGPLDKAQYADARNRLQAVDRQPLRRGWTLAGAASVDLPPFGTVQELVHYDNAYSLTAYSYSVFGPARIALFTITFRGIKPDAAAAARRLVAGLQWRNEATPRPAQGNDDRQDK